MPRATREERLAKINERRAKLDQDARKLQASISRDNRKKETRGKVLLGVVLLETIKNEPGRVNWCMKQIRTYLSKRSDLAFLKELYDLPLSTTPLPPDAAPPETQVSDPS